MGVKDISKTMTLKDGVSGTLEKMSAGTVRYKKTLQDLKETANSTWSSIKTGAGVAVAAVGAAATAATSIGIKANASAEMAEKSFGILLNSTEDAKKMVSDLHKLGLESPFEFAGLQESAKKLLGMGFAGEKVIPMLHVLGDAVAAVGGNTDQMEGIALAIGQIQSKGKVSAEEMNQLAERGIPAWALMSKQMGKSTAELMKMSENGELFADVAIPALMKGLNERFNGSMKAMSDTWDYTIANMKEMATLGLAGVTKPLFIEIKKDLQDIQKRMGGDDVSIWGARFSTALLNIYNGAKSVAGAILTVSNFIANNWGIIGPIVYGAATAFTAYGVGLVAVRAWTLATAAATWIMANAQLGLGAAIRANPIGVLLTLLGLLVTAGTYVVQNWEQVKLAGMNTWNVIVDATQWGVNGAIDLANALMRSFNYVWDSIKYSGTSIWNVIISAAETGINAILKKISPFSSLLSKAGINIPASVDFSGAKSVAVKPTVEWDKNWINHVSLSKGKFSDDSIMAQTQKAQAERDKKQQQNEDKLVAALNENTKATSANTDSTAINTAATDANTARLKDNLSPMEIADTLFNRIDRHLWASG